jgi:translocation and assembly module TamB
VAPGPAGTGFQLTALNGSMAAQNIEVDGKPFGNLNATASTAGGAVHYNLDSNLLNSSIRASGQTQLSGDHATTASASIANLPIDRILALAGRGDVPVKGSLNVNAQFSGTLQNPTGSGTVAISNGSAYNEPFTRIQASVNLTNVLIEMPQLRIDDGPANLELSASFNHPAGDFQDGQLQFRVRSNDIPLARLHTVANARPGLAGMVQLTAVGAAALHRNAPMAFSNLDAHLTAQNLSMDQKNLGSLTASATTSGSAVDFSLNSNLANARVQGSGHVGLATGYPIDAQLNFSGVTWSGLSPFLATTAQPIDASLDGQVTVSGSATGAGGLRGSVQLTKLEAHSVATDAVRKPRVNFEIHNDGNIQLSLANSVVTVQNFRLTGPSTNLALSGTASLGNSQSLNLRANGNVKLDMLEAFSQDIASSGAVTLNAAVTGSASQPVINGRLQLQNASLHLISLPNGLSNASGAVNFNGSEAVIDNLSGEIGGGKLTLAGFVAYGGPEPQFHIQASASHVSVDYPETVTTEANARLTLTGSESRSLLSGNVTILSVAMHSHSDVGSMLTSAATPPSANGPSTGLLAGLRFDVRIQTSPGVRFRTSLTQDLQADGDVTLRGSPDHPGMLGRMTVNSGNVVFFGSKYTVDQGGITFYNPNRIEPVLNVDLETTVLGVDVTIAISGPMEKLKLSYRSDPPLEFEQIVSLLAAGKMPTTDPVIASQQPPVPQQSFGQAGASAILGQAVNPVSGRLQRLFGVTSLSIDPSVAGETSNNPQATLTLQQKVSQNITFTYIQNVSTSNPTGIRIEWAITPQFSAVAQRDIFGEFALDFFYKKRFH